MRGARRALTCGVAALVLGMAVAVARGQPELIDRTLAIVAGQAITLSDARAVLELGLISPGRAADPIAAAARQLVDRVLVLREVQRYAPPEPAEAAVESRLHAVAARFADAEGYRAALRRVGFAEDLLRNWVRDELRIASYIDQRFTAAVVPSADDIAAEYARRRDEFDQAGLSFAQAAPAIREQLTAERRAELVDDWIADLRRRTPVVELWRQ